MRLIARFIVTFHQEIKAGFNFSSALSVAFVGEERGDMGDLARITEC